MVGLVLAALGLALALLGYMRTTVVAVARGVSAARGCVLASYLITGRWRERRCDDLRGTVILLVLGSVFYRASVFVIGAGIGFGIGAVFWVLVSGDVEPGGTGLTLSGWNRVQIFVGSLVPGIVVGIIFLSWERRLMTLSAVIIGAALMLFGLRYSGLPLGVREWTPLLAGAAITAGLWLSSRIGSEESDQPDESDYTYTYH